VAIKLATHERRLEVREPRWADLPARYFDGQAQRLKANASGCDYVAAIFNLWVSSDDTTAFQ
jgi:hypothetical protein